MACGGWLPDGLVLKRSTNMSTVSPGSLAPSQTGADPPVKLLLTWVCVEQNEVFFFFCLVLPQSEILPLCCCGIRLNLLLIFTRMTFSLVSFCISSFFFETQKIFFQMSKLIFSTTNENGVFWTIKPQKWVHSYHGFSNFLEKYAVPTILKYKDSYIFFLNKDVFILCLKM